MIKARIKRLIITLGKLSKTLSKPRHFSANFIGLLVKIQTK